MGQALLISLLSSLAAFLFGLVAREAVRLWTEVRPARKVWRIDRTVTVSIVTSDGPDRGNKDVRVTWEADALAATAVAHHLGHAQGISAPRATSFKSFPSRDMGNNLVVIGGPAMNGLYRQMENRMNVPYTFNLLSDHARIIRNSDKRTFAQLVSDGRTLEDYAIITLAGNPARPASQLVMLAGCGATGTLAAAELVTSSRIREIAKLVNSKDFVSIVIQVELIHGYMTEPRIVDHKYWRAGSSHPNAKTAADHFDIFLESIDFAEDNSRRALFARQVAELAQRHKRDDVAAELMDRFDLRDDPEAAPEDAHEG
jgi:hypothetical protein